MSTNWNAEANFARLGADASTFRRKQNDRDGNLVTIKNITMAAAEYGYDEADLCEAIAEGYGKTDPSKYTFTILEYMFRYTSKYGALLLIAIGLISTIYLAATKGKDLWDATIGEDAKKQKEKEAASSTKKDDKAYFMGMGGSNIEVATALSLGMMSILPPVTYAAVIKILPMIVPGFGSSGPVYAPNSPPSSPPMHNPLAGKQFVRTTQTGTHGVYQDMIGFYCYSYASGTIAGPYRTPDEAEMFCDPSSYTDFASRVRAGMSSLNAGNSPGPTQSQPYYPIMTAQAPVNQQSNVGRTIGDIRSGVGLINDLRDLFKSGSMSSSEQEIVSDLARDIARDSSNMPGSLGIQR